MHGGDIYRNQVRLDFSVNVNPLGIAEEVRNALVGSIDRAATYPDLTCTSLKNRLAEHFDWQADRILCGNGASELIWAICRWKNQGTVLLPAPGFSGYKTAAEAAEQKTDFYDLWEEKGFTLTGTALKVLKNRIREERPDLLFLTNPSNPAGIVTGREEMNGLAQICEENGTILVVDECFAELADDPETLTMTKELSRYPHMMILRAFTKSFAIPGIRTGYLLCGEGIDVRKLAIQLPEWNVSVPAQAAALAALRQEQYLKDSREVIRRERGYLKKELQDLGAVVYPSETNFLLFRWRDPALYEKLLKRGILIRDCSDYRGLTKGFFRIAVRQHKDNEELIKVLREQDREKDG